MKSSIHLTALLLATTSLLGAAEWQTIFNGRNLDGWKSSPDNPAAFSVQPGGVLKVNGKRAHLYWVGEQAEQNFSNFELKLKVRTMPKANSGVFIHTKFQEEGWPAHGYEAQVNSSHGDPRKTGSIYGVVDCWADPEAFAANPDRPAFITVDPQAGTRLHVPTGPTRDGEWFDYDIKVIDKTVTLSVDGNVIVEYTEPEHVEGTRKLSAGTIAIQAHDPGSTVYYKDIQLKILD